ncbi:LPS translocon maturation chaperone LptM [Ramlibacter sp. MAHUQ-53]|uniref:LPS translocon maturation chaperone LptM n=1 Tax=unclassified Ramlibacter TaxID=2617605 RepID=UPI00362A368A
MFAWFQTILVTGLSLAAALALSACGQKGDLYLPAGYPQPAAKASPAAAPAPLPALSPASSRQP